MNKRFLVRKISSSTLAFFLAIILFGMNITLALQLGFFRNNTIIDSMNKSHYYEQSYDAFQKQMKKLMSSTSIPPVIMKEVFSLKRYYIDARNHTNHVLEGAQTAKYQENGQKETIQNILQRKVTTDKIYQEILHYYEEMHNNLTAEQKSELEQLSENIYQVYDNYLNLNLLVDLVLYRDQFHKYSRIILPILIIAGAAIEIMLCRMYRHKHNALRYITYSMLGASAMCSCFAIMLEQKYNYGSIVKEPAYYQKFIETYTKDSVNMLYYAAGLGIFLFLILVTIVQFMRKKVIGEQ